MFVQVAPSMVRLCSFLYWCRWGAVRCCRRKTGFGVRQTTLGTFLANYQLLP